MAWHGERKLVDYCYTLALSNSQTLFIHLASEIQRDGEREETW